jgi:NAD-dependent dihydropyrimidine dehydrogenase PreA subunit
MAPRNTPREKLSWFPTINYDVCISDLTCLNFCSYDVFEWDEDTGRPIVAHPYRCVPGCQSCAETCRAKAISLPSKEEFRARLRRLRGEARTPAAPKLIS